jgi:hypothetical protein
MAECVTAVVVDLACPLRRRIDKADWPTPIVQLLSVSRGNPQSIQRPHDGSARKLATLRKLLGATR